MLCPSRFRILKIIFFFFIKKDEKPDSLAVIGNYNFCDIQTDIHGNFMTDLAQRAELMKIYSFENCLFRWKILILHLF